jgi:hypothetical protein
MLQRLGHGVLDQLRDRYLAMAASTAQARQEAAQRMMRRAERVLKWDQAVSQELYAMSAREWGHVAGRAVFDALSFGLAGKALGVVKLGLQEVYHAEILLQSGRKVSQALESAATRLDTITTTLARKIVTAAEPEIAIAGVNLKSSWQALKQEAEQVLGSAGKLVVGNKAVNNYSLFEKCVPFAKTTQELATAFGPEINTIIANVADKCKSIGLPAPDMRTFQHVISGHMSKGSRLFRRDIERLRSVFNTNEDWIQLGIEAWEKGVLEKPGVKVYDFGRVIGRSLETGEPISKVRIVTKNGRWLTTYPIETII